MPEYILTPARASYLKRTYGLTEDDYWDLWDKQRGFCPVCKTALPDTGANIDHDHKTLLVRGITHPYCNRYRIGRYNDWKEVQQVADYLKNPPAAGMFPPIPKKRRKRGAKGKALPVRRSRP